MSGHLERITNYAERLGACAALAAGGGLIVVYAKDLVLGPVVPQIMGILLGIIAMMVASRASISLALSYRDGSKLRLVAISLLSGSLQLVCVYFISAAILAAKTAAP